MTLSWQLPVGCGWNCIYSIVALALNFIVESRFVQTKTGSRGQISLKKTLEDYSSDTNHPINWNFTWVILMTSSSKITKTTLIQFKTLSPGHLMILWNKLKVFDWIGFNGHLTALIIFGRPQDRERKHRKSTYEFIWFFNVPRG